ncbi:hypothetical protein [Hyphomicrobium sp. ghe19]|uniref:hypothetical protein n=1 Tax=Hyphomicrobium sp. ghe19 TaxID=2682968 RepID=UPI0013678283|nr:hypothetical protein HYPP_03711 [Hyphomicrobium sp. ghe19]
MRIIQIPAVTLLAFTAANLMIGIETAEAGRIHPVPNYPNPAGPEHRGCYWMRQREYCGRYCYTEVNGQRYCTERERSAYPQGPFYEPPRDAGYPMKIGGPRQ